MNLKKYSLFRLPSILIIVLNRYSSNGIKNNTIVNYPVHDLTIKEKKSKRKLSYNLNNIINHYGIHIGGHYNCISNINDTWFFIDDSHISVINDFIMCRFTYFMLDNIAKIIECR